MCRRFVAAFVVVGAGVVPALGSAQERETLFGGATELRAAWGIVSSASRIQGDMSGTLGLFAGMSVNGTTTLGFTLAANVTHPTVNFGYFGIEARHAWQPDKLWHPAAGILLAFAGTKDYERPKSSPFDNFGNTSGARFGFVEPSVVAEVNLTERFRLRAGLGLRVPWGLRMASMHTMMSGVRGRDFGGATLVFGVGS